MRQVTRTQKGSSSLLHYLLQAPCRGLVRSKTKQVKLPANDAAELAACATMPRRKWKRRNKAEKKIAETAEAAKKRKRL